MAKTDPGLAMATVRNLFDTPEGRAAAAAKSEGAAPSPPAKLAAPDWLSPTGRKTFGELVKAIRSAAPDDTLAGVDVFLLALAAEQYALASMASKAMRGQGGHLKVLEVDQAHRDRLRKHPAIQVLRDSTLVFVRIAKDFGGSPAARKALEDYIGSGGGAGGEPDDDELDLFGET